MSGNLVYLQNKPCHEIQPEKQVLIGNTIINLMLNWGNLYVIAAKVLWFTGRSFFSAAHAAGDISPESSANAF